MCSIDRGDQTFGWKLVVSLGFLWLLQTLLQLAIVALSHWGGWCLVLKKVIFIQYLVFGSQVHGIKWVVFGLLLQDKEAIVSRSWEVVWFAGAISFKQLANRDFHSTLPLQTRLLHVVQTWWYGTSPATRIDYLKGPMVLVKLLQWIYLEPVESLYNVNVSFPGFSNALHFSSIFWACYYDSLFWTLRCKRRGHCSLVPKHYHLKLESWNDLELR